MPTTPEPTMNDVVNWLPKDGEWHSLGNGSEIKYIGTFKYSDRGWGPLDAND